MKNLLILLCCLLLTACAAPASPAEATETTEQNMMIGNPWKDYASLAEAEAACGLAFPLEETVAGNCIAETFRVLNGELLEVRYRDDAFEVTVRMQAGEGQDLSGVYAEFENTVTFEEKTYTITHKNIENGGLLTLISKDGFSYSFYAPNRYWGDSAADFLAFLNE